LGLDSKAANLNPTPQKKFSMGEAQPTAIVPTLNDNRSTPAGPPTSYCWFTT
jgi:hypothetical protein